MGIVIAVLCLVAILIISARHKVIDHVAAFKSSERKETRERWQAAVIDRSFEDSIDQWMFSHNEELFSVIKSFMAGDEAWDWIRKEDFPISNQFPESNWKLVKIVLMSQRGKLPLTVATFGDLRLDICLIDDTEHCGEHARWVLKQSMKEALFLRVTWSIQKYVPETEAVLKDLNGKCYPLEEYVKRNGRGSTNGYYTWSSICPFVNPVD